MMRIKTHWRWLCTVMVMVFVCQMQAQEKAQHQIGTVTINCDNPPIIVCPPDFQSCPGVSTHPANTGHATGLAAGPLCSPPFVNYSDSIVSTNGCAGSIHIIRTWIATHPQNPTLTASCEQTIILADTTPPLILGCPSDTTVAPNGGCFANVFWDQPLVFDDCGNLTLTVSHVSGDRFPKGTTTVTYTATDACGNVTTCSFDINVEGECCDLPPIIFCPGDFLGCPGDTILPKKIGRAMAMAGRPNCDPPVVFYRDDTISMGPCPGALMVDRTWFAVDPHNPNLNARCVQRITLEDKRNPFIFGCPQDITVDSDERCQAIVTWVLPSARDNCSGVMVQSNHEPGDTFSVGTTTVIYVATDACGNRATCSFDVTVIKKCCDEQPIIDCPADFVGCPGTSTDPSVTGTAVARPGGPNCKQPMLRYEETIVSQGPCPGAVKIKRLWIAQDSINPMLRSTCIQFITLKDTIAPQLVMCTSDTTLKTNAGCRATLSWEDPVFTDNCGGVTLTSTHAKGDTFDIGNTTVTYTATDSCGNTATCSFVITVLDDCCNKPPIIMCPPTFTTCPKKDINPDITGRPTVEKSHPTCGTPIVSFSDSVVSSGPCPNEMRIERTWTATDPNNPNLMASCIQIIELTDKVKPIFWECPNDTIVAPNVDCYALVGWIPPLATDNCGLVSVTSNFEPGDTFRIGITTVIYTAVDGCGNDTTCTFTVTVKDECCELPPTINCPPDFSGCPGADIDPDFTGRATAQKSSAFCDDPVITFADDTIGNGNCPNSAIIERTWTAVIPNKPNLRASCVQLLTLDDKEPPVLSNCPSDTSVAPDDNCMAVVFWTRPGISDNCGISGVTSTHMPGDTFQLGTTTVTYTLTDVCGLKSTCSFTVTVRDECCNKPPIITCPADFNGCPMTPLDPATTGVATAVKGHPTCDDPIITSQDRIVSTGPCAGALRVERTWIATDPNNADLADSCMQLITLNDLISPMISNCPNDTTLSPNVDCEAQVFWNNPTVSDNCGTPVLTSTHNSGDLFPIGQTTVILTATDGCGNTATCSFVITVRDDCCNKPPVIACPADYEGCPSTSLDTSITGIATATKGHPTCDDPIITMVDTVVSQGPCMGATVIDRIWTATDPNNANLFATCTQRLVLRDLIDPVISNCPSDTTLSPNIDCEAQVFWNAPTVSDNCGTPTITGTHSSGDLFPIGQTTVVLTATDGCGNTATCSFVITVRDDCCNKPPVITCPVDYQACPSTSTDPSVTGMATATKGHPTCDDPAITFFDRLRSNGPCPGAMLIERIWYATDPNDNNLVDSCVQMIELKDTINPVLTDCPGHINAQANEDCIAIVNWNLPTATDQCAGVVLRGTHQPGDTFPVGVTTVVYTATDRCGNTATCSFDVEVESSNIHLMCPGDTTITSPSFSFGEYVKFKLPEVVQCDPTCPDSIPGFIYMGERNGHRYYCSDFRATWKDAQEICDSLGGYLAVVNDEAENTYLAGLLMGQPAYIGLNDFQTEGQFEWVNGDPLNFTNWAAGQPDDELNYQDVAELYPNGLWEDQFQYIRNEFICEIPCVTLEQIEGTENGGFFTCGETKVTYVATDANGDADTCSFLVNVDCNNYQPYCFAKGLNSDKYWLNSISLDDFGKITGNDGGYGDYTPTCIEVTSNERSKICVGVGYSGLPENVFWRAWIDYNGDRDFDDQGELVAGGFGQVAMCDHINIPDIRDRRTFMRVAISKGRIPASCGFVPDGEYEDYCIFINDPTRLQVIIEEEAYQEQTSTTTPNWIRQFKVYPNPAHDQITLDWQGSLPSHIQIIDVMGRHQLSMKGSQIGSTNQIDVSRWHSGRYHIVAFYPEGDQKFVSLIIADD